jgi:transmembrane sensor
MNEERFTYLLDLYVTGNLEKPEQREFFDLLEDPLFREELEKKMEREWLQNQYEEAGNEQVGRAIEQNVLKRITYETPVLLKPRTRVVFMRRAVAVAVVLVTLAGAGYLLLTNNKKEKTTARTTAKIEDISPGGNKAVLTLADHSNIVLDDAANGKLAQQGKTTIVKSNDGQLAYTHPTGGEITGKVLYNTLSTPRGGQYQLVLPDGSRVWLNAASSITYPAAFTGTERKVTISGEAYFEVAKNARMPFIVGEGNLSVQVLGTHFNVNGYKDDGAIKTTLLEGKVKVVNQQSPTSRGGQAIGGGQKAKDKDASVVLKPGEQAIAVVSPLTTDHSPLTIDHSPDIDQVIAWKNGQFLFKDATIESIMNQVARWYDVEVVYDATISKHFIANIPRIVSLSELLKLLELTGQVHFKVQGRKITVLP